MHGQFRSKSARGANSVSMQPLDLRWLAEASGACVFNGKILLNIAQPQGECRA